MFEAGAVQLIRTLPGWPATFDAETFLGAVGGQTTSRGAHALDGLVPPAVVAVTAKTRLPGFTPEMVQLSPVVQHE